MAKKTREAIQKIKIYIYILACNQEEEVWDSQQMKSITLINKFYVFMYSKLLLSGSILKFKCDIPCIKVLVIILYKAN